MSKAEEANTNVADTQEQASEQTSSHPPYNGPPPDYGPPAQPQQAFGPSPQQPYGAPPQQQPYGAPPQQPYGAQPIQPHYGAPQPYVIPVGQTVMPGAVVVQSGFVAVMQFRDSPVRCTCQHCNSEVVTALDYKIGLLSWMICGTICLIGLGLPFLWLCCCFIPFCIPACKDVIHNCPNCKKEMGRFQRHGGNYTRGPTVA